ncbi:hAMP domain protein [Sesbania bispinosa]|nr:hAMP domain protein [Sesbania bispinosa]
MENRVIDTFAVDGEGLEVDEAIDVEDAEVAISVGGDEVARVREVGRGVEGEGVDGGGVLVKEAEGGGSREVIEVGRVEKRGVRVCFLGWRVNPQMKRS